jgi:hypothetical protein
MSVTSTANAKKWAQTVANVTRIGYQVLALVVTLGLSYYFYSVLNRPAAGILIFIGVGLIFFYYWVKWFVTKQPLDPDFMPTTNACPDYLSIVPSNTVDPATGAMLYKPASNTSYLCVDYVGVSRNGALKKMDPAKISSLINNPSYVFSVDPTSDFKGAKGHKAFLDRLIAAGLSYNSLGEESLPTKGRHSNGSPAYHG